MNPDRAEMDLQRLLHLPWTVDRETTPEGDELLRVREIPSAVGCGASDQERIEDLWQSLTESLRAYLHFGDAVPMPQGGSAAWTRITPPVTAGPKFFIVNAAPTDTGAVAALG